MISQSHNTFSMQCLNIRTGLQEDLVFELDTSGEHSNHKGERIRMTVFGQTVLVNRSDFKSVFKSLRKLAHQIYDIQNRAEEIVFDDTEEI